MIIIAINIILNIIKYLNFRLKARKFYFAVDDFLVCLEASSVPEEFGVNYEANYEYVSVQNGCLRYDYLAPLLEWDFEIYLSFPQPISQNRLLNHCFNHSILPQLFHLTLFKQCSNNLIRL